MFDERSLNAKLAVPWLHVIVDLLEGKTSDPKRCIPKNVRKPYAEVFEDWSTLVQLQGRDSEGKFTLTKRLKRDLSGIYRNMITVGDHEGRLGTHSVTEEDDLRATLYLFYKISEGDGKLASYTLASSFRFLAMKSLEKDGKLTTQLKEIVLKILDNPDPLEDELRVILDSLHKQLVDYLLDTSWAKEGLVKQTSEGLLVWTTDYEKQFGQLTIKTNPLGNADYFGG